MGDITHDIVSVTPQLAAEWLEANTGNRNVRKGHVESLARDMRAGRWTFNGDAIRFRRDGTLIDGQHRLMACIASGVTIQTAVVRGLGDEAYLTIDGGAKRTAADALRSRDVHNANAVAAAVRVLSGAASGRWHAARVTAPEVDAVLLRHPGIEASATAAAACFPGMGATLVAVHYVGVYAGAADRANDFLAVWKSGTPDYTGDPAHLLRERFIRMVGTAHKMAPGYRQKLTFHAWLSFGARRRVSIIKAPDTLKVPGWTMADYIGGDHG